MIIKYIYYSRHLIAKFNHNILWRIISKAAFKHIYIIYHISYTEEIYVKRFCVGGGYEFSANVDHCRLCKNPTHDHYSPTHSARKQSFLADPAGGGEDKQKKKRTGRDSFAGK